MNTNTEQGLSNAALAAKLAALEERLAEDEKLMGELLQHPIQHVTKKQLKLQLLVNENIKVLGPNWQDARVEVWPDEAHATVRGVPRCNRPDGGYDVTLTTLFRWINMKRKEQGLKRISPY